MHTRLCKRLIELSFLALLPLVAGASTPNPVRTGEEVFVTANEPGIPGGRLVVALRAEPKTLNPLQSNDAASREVISQMTADLIHINRRSQEIEPGLAKSWSVSADGLHYTLQLRRGVRFSDAAPFDADDVLFSFKLYLDEKVNTPQRGSLVIGNKPIAVRKTGPYTVVFDLTEPYASAERLFDSVAILPRHLLEGAYNQGRVARDWGLNTSPSEIACLGPYCLKQYVAGQRITLARNPYYWKSDRAGQRLPYIDEITFIVAGNEDAEVLRFEAGEVDIINRVSAENYAVLGKEQASHSFRLYDAGPSLEYNFVLLNLNSTVPAKDDGLRRRQAWFGDVNFRRAVSLAIDREGINRLVYQGRGSPIWTHVTPGNLLWIDKTVPHPARSTEQARGLLKAAGFSWGPGGTLLDSHGAQVEFSLITSASSNQRSQMATMIQQDLKDLGISVQVVPLEFKAMLDRIFQTHDYDAAVMGLGGGDVDPNSQLNVWLSSGDDHLWNLGESQPATTWEAEMDRMMKQQMSRASLKQRKALYDRVQEIEAEDIPVVFLVSPHVLVGAKNRVRNFRPAVLDSHTLWNSEQLYLGDGKVGDERP